MAHRAVGGGAAGLQVARLKRRVVGNGPAGSARHGARDLAALDRDWEQRAKAILRARTSSSGH